MTMLCIMDNDGSIPHNGVLVECHMSIVPELKRTIEAAGHGFAAYYEEKVLGKYNKTQEEESKGEAEEDKEEFNKDKVSEWEKKRHAHKAASLAKMSDLYFALGLGDIGLAASDKEIRAAYFKMALIYHPDKQKQDENSPLKHGETDPKWLEIQKAYDTLIDPEKRRKYDSTLEFDDEIPDETKVDPANFFDVYRPVFRRNALWSTKKPVPDLGDDKAEFKDIDKFYDFWFSFDSWRDFSHCDEYNLDDAEDRYEKRYMERENKRLKAQALKKEKQRLMKLVETAYENDPRILRRRKEAEEAKKREKEQRKENKRKAIAEREKAEADAAQAKLEAEQEAKRQEEESKKNAQLRERNAQREFISLLETKIKAKEYDIFWGREYLKTLSVDEVLRANELFKECSEDKAKNTVKEFIETIAKEREIQKQEQALKDAKNASLHTKTWTADEVALLHKGIVKFPVGTKCRWEIIAQYVKTKTADEVIAKAKELSGGNTSLRTLGEKTKKNVAPWEKGEPKKTEDEEEESAKDQAKKAPVPAPAKAEAPKDKDAPAEEKKSSWTQDMQAALEAGMKKFPASMDPKERWTKIAEGVPGKTPKECVERFKELKALVQKKDGAPAPAPAPAKAAAK